MTLVASSPSQTTALAAAGLQAALAEFAAATTALADRDASLRDAVEQLRHDLAQARNRLHDETARRARSEARLGSMFAAVPFGLVAVEDGRVAGFNQAAARLLPGLEEQAPWHLPVGWHRRGDSQEYTTGRGDQARIVEVRVLRDEPGLAPTLVRLEDVTDALRAREQAGRQDRLAAMGRMTAEVAHQLRTPLCTATLYASQLCDTTLDAAARRQMAERVCTQLGQLDALITRMLGFVKTSARDREACDIQALLQGQLEVIAPLLSQRRLRLALQLEASGCMLVLDRLQIGAALLALLENALQHAPEAGTLVVGCAQRGHRLEITVADDGPGISPEMAARLFEPFGTGRGKGTGLGLAIAQAAAKAHGGELAFAARQPSGVCFTLALPTVAAL